jgi:soluble lytic murein transglycosylase-like protein
VLVVNVRRYRPRHLKTRPKSRGPIVVGTAAAVWMSAPAARAGVHVVAPGETLSGIAARYGTSVQALAATNGLRDPSLILAGQHLRVPARATATSAHVVAAGETLSAIAARYGTTVAALARANRIEDANLIVVGTRLRVPAGAASAPGPSRAAIEVALEDQAKEHGVEPSLVKAVAWQESGWQQEAVSKVGAIGVMQVMPDTAKYVNESLEAGDLDVRSAPDNVALGVSYLDHLLDTMPSKDKALAAYLSGPAAVGRKLERYQKHYVENVEALEPRF